MKERPDNQLSPQELLERDQKLLEALCIDYTAVYYCNLAKNTMEPIKRSALSNGSVIDAAIPERRYEYTYRIQYFYDNFVVKESAPDFLESSVSLFCGHTDIDNIIMMPIMGGLEATRTIRASAHPDAKTVPIFAMTANAFTDDIARSKKAGMNEHLTKPLNSKSVIQMIRKYVGKKEAEADTSCEESL